MYDITENKIRNRFIKFLRNLGCLRVQKSVFLGEVSEIVLETIEYEISNIIDLASDSIYIFPISKREYRDSIFMDKRQIQNILEMSAIIL
ncbi:CRISPR-associated endonuclease Cas2 [Candidatus Cetobacterium colombiensis]|uniref:CRISPR-associated endoribonuclease Cas2 n=1 Tax=Candidatus Cetobacterium colombiensis TaxID=3073100 RepID=A0ABU4WCN7_9FUSO|nr:CRISPR-associated endonuclease Cas2 [Candidatus Cetobacterium colombiensis]MDX8337289.1 CRISPR-associated endonuclease Cas2 [Candidatus Cetobacterium colombiensis]